MKPLDTTKIWVVIPAYAEEQVIAETIRNVLVHVPNIVVVDDCSPDKTSEKAFIAGAHVLRHPLNLGQGAALQTGIEYAFKNGCEYVVTFDADGQHTAEEILPMLHALNENGAMVALGSRFLGKTLHMSWQRRWILKTSLLFTRITTGGLELTDVHNGFRIMTREFCSMFKFTQNRMAHASEILYYIAKTQTPFIEFPVTISYTEYSVHKGQKSSNALRILLELTMKYISK